MLQTDFPPIPSYLWLPDCHLIPINHTDVCLRISKKHTGEDREVEIER